MRQFSSSSSIALGRRRVFISYSHRDIDLKIVLLQSIRQFEFEGVVESWDDTKLIPGSVLDDSIFDSLDKAHIALLLLTKEYFQSSYCMREGDRALWLLKEERTIPVPIVLTKCDWRASPFSSLVVLPPDGKPLANASGKISGARLTQLVEGLRVTFTNSAQRSRYGATLSARTTISSARATPPPNPPTTKLLTPSSSTYAPPTLRAVRLSRIRPSKLEMILDGGDVPTTSLEQATTEWLLRLFSQSLAITEQNAWVDFDPLGRTNPLPDVLEQTELGDALLRCDYTLKIFTASLLHPDTPSGSLYWNSVINRTRQMPAADDLPLVGYHRVTISPKVALVYEAPEKYLSRESDENTSTLHKWLTDPEMAAAYIVESSLQISAETPEAELYALDSDLSTSIPRQKAQDLLGASQEAFDQFIHPILDYELNHGRHFAVARQMYSAMILAAWMKKAAKTNSFMSHELGTLMDSNLPRNKVMSYSSMSPLDSPTGLRTPSNVIAPESPRHHAPSAGMQLRHDYYQKYLRSLRAGLFRVARPASSSIQDPTSAIAAGADVMYRIYTAGAIRLALKFRDISCDISRPNYLPPYASTISAVLNAE